MGIIEKMRLDGKKGFVTGAARGIGKCTATAFAEAGADILTLTSKKQRRQRKNLLRRQEERLSQSRQTVQTKSRLMQW